MSRSTIVPALAALGLLALPAALPAQETADLSDPEVAHVAVTANTIDAELATLARDRALSPAVRAFARTMITDHTAVNAQAAALAGRLGVTPQDNAVSQSLQQGAREARQRIEQATGSAFDRAYMEREIAFHQAVLDALDGLLIPTTANAELKALLVDVRPAIAAHLEHARQVNGRVAAAQ
jgi:putative membrane protein